MPHIDPWTGVAMLSALEAEKHVSAQVISILNQISDTSEVETGDWVSDTTDYRQATLMGNQQAYYVDIVHSIAKPLVFAAAMTGANDFIDLQFLDQQRIDSTTVRVWILRDAPPSYSCVVYLLGLG